VTLVPLADRDRRGDGTLLEVDMSLKADKKDLAARLEAAFKKPPKPRVVETLAIAGAGHFRAQSGWLPLDPSRDTKLNIAAAKLVRTYRDGESAKPAKRVYRNQFYTNIDVLVDDEVRNGKIKLAEIDDDVQEALTSLALGTWDESDHRFMRTMIPGFIVTYFVLGLR
jgi:hypothetical protein